MKKIVIIGGGFAGLRLLYRLRKTLRNTVDITLLDRSEFSIEKPSLPEVAFSGKETSKVRIPLRQTVERKGSKFIHDGAVKIDPIGKAVLTEGGARINYDILVVATGAVKDYDSIPGFREYGFSVCDDFEAERLAGKLGSFRGGRIVIGSARSEWDPHSTDIMLDAPCEGPIGEVMFMVDTYLREQGIREKSTITVFSPGAVFFDDVGESVHAELSPYIKEHEISVLTGKVLSGIGDHSVHFSDGSDLESDLTIVIPPYRGPDVITSSGLGDSRGFVKTGDDMRHREYRDIFVIGDVNAGSMPKLGHIAIMQADVAAAAIIQEITKHGEIPKPKPEIFCIMNRGSDGATVILSDILFGGKRDIAYSGRLASSFKWGFDSYYFFTHGHMPPEIFQGPVEWLVKLLRTNE
ncbi:MAG: NAD(P)/FAD-dependent oxidoreductase [Thermoplasmata archaeon]